MVWNPITLQHCRNSHARGTVAACTRFPSCLRGQGIDSLVSGGCRCASETTDFGDLHGPCLDSFHGALSSFCRRLKNCRIRAFLATILRFSECFPTDFWRFLVKAESANILARSLRDFFTNHLPRIRGTSPNTILSYRDTFKLLLRFAASHLNRNVANLDLVDLGPLLIVEFLVTF
jgi:hypothetical protein